jgi:hypothetical protein
MNNYLTTGKFLAYLAMIFVAGGAAGTALTLKNTREREAHPPTVEKVCNRLQDRLVSKLSLTDEQVKKLQPIFDETAQELHAIHARAIRDTDQIIRKAHQRISPELSPEQKSKLEQFDRERHEWLRRHLKDRETAP